MERLDPGLSKRPSRFDRKYLFALPTEHERVLYCEFWRAKLKGKPVEFPQKLCAAIASITGGFSFAFLQEAFIATLLVLARDEEGGDSVGDIDELLVLSSLQRGSEEGRGLNKYPLWRVIKEQIRILRDELDRSPGASAAGCQKTTRHTCPVDETALRSDLDCGMYRGESLRHMQVATIRNPLMEHRHRQVSQMENVACICGTGKFDTNAFRNGPQDKADRLRSSGQMVGAPWLVESS